MSGAIKETRIELVVKADAKALWERFQILPPGQPATVHKSKPPEFDYIANELSRGGGQNGPLFKGQPTDTDFFLNAVTSHALPPGTPMALVIAAIPSLGVRNFIAACLRSHSPQRGDDELGELQWNDATRRMCYIESPVSRVEAMDFDSGKEFGISGKSEQSLSFNEDLVPQGEFESRLKMTLACEADLLEEMIGRLQSSENYARWFSMHEGIEFSLELTIDGKIQEIKRAVHADSPPAIAERRDFGGRRYLPVPTTDILVPSKAFRHAPSVKRSFAIGAAVAMGVLAVFVVAVSIRTYGVAVPVIAGLFGALTSVIGGSVGASAALAFIGLGGGVKVLKDHRSNQNLALAVGQTKRNSVRPEDKSLLPDGRDSSGAASGSVSSVTVTPQEA